MDQRIRGADAAAGLVPTGVVVLSVTCAAAVYKVAVAGDVGSVAFVTVSYAALLKLLGFVCAYEVAPPDAAAERERLRRRVWALCTLLTALFAWKVVGAMPWPVALGVWAVAAATSAGGFVALFRHRHL